MSLRRTGAAALLIGVAFVAALATRIALDDGPAPDTRAPGGTLGRAETAVADGSSQLATPALRSASKTPPLARERRARSSRRRASDAPRTAPTSAAPAGSAGTRRSPSARPPAQPSPPPAPVAATRPAPAATSRPAPATRPSPPAAPTPAPRTPPADSEGFHSSD